MSKLHHHVTTVVKGLRRETDRVVVYELGDPDDWDLPPFTAGAHIDVRLQGGLVRQYSLCGDPSERNRYRIAVQAEPGGRGGSVALQQQLQVGTVVPVSLPRNHFPLDPAAERHLLIAGGIGITPFLPMLEVLRAGGVVAALHYCTRAPEVTAFREHLAQPHYQGLVTLHHDHVADANPLDLDALLATPVPGQHVYCCGPSGLIDAVLRRTAGFPPGTVHVEQFGGSRTGAEAAFTVELRRSGREIEVAGGETILEALRRAEVPIDSSCEAGVCNACRVRHLDGAPIHRDLILKPHERAEFMLPCVSGCASKRLVLDL